MPALATEFIRRPHPSMGFAECRLQGAQKDSYSPNNSIRNAASSTQTVTAVR